MEVSGIKSRLKYLRKKEGLTITQFAEKIGVSPGNVGDWESSRRISIPGAQSLISISRAFNVSLDWLLLGPWCQEPLLFNPLYSRIPGNGELFQSEWENYSRFIKKISANPRIQSLLEDAEDLEDDVLENLCFLMKKLKRKKQIHTR